MFFSEHCGKPPFSVASEPLIDEAASHAAFVCACICATLGIAGNLCTGLVLMGDRSIRRNPTTPFLMSLALSDLIFSCFNLPLLAMRFHLRGWPMGYGTCQLFPFFYYSNVIISALSMALIALNRLAGIYRPALLPSFFTPKKSWLLVLATWLTAMGLMALPLSGVWGQMGYEPATFSCTVLPKNDHSPMVFLVLVGMVLPCTIMIVCYAMILYHVRSTGKAMRSVLPAEEAEQQPELVKDRSIRQMTLRRERQLTRTLSMICAAFLVCFLPTSLLMVFDPMPPCYKHPDLHVAGYVVFWCSAFVNPIIYTLSNRVYRNAFLGYVRRCLGKAGLAVEPSSSTWYDLKDPTSPAETLVMRSSYSSGRSSRRSEKRVQLEEEDNVVVVVHEDQRL